MKYVALIHGAFGTHRYLGPRAETPDEKRASWYASPDAAKQAAKAHISAFPACIARQMKFEVKPL